MRLMIMPCIKEEKKEFINLIVKHSLRKIIQQRIIQKSSLNLSLCSYLPVYTGIPCGNILGGNPSRAWHASFKDAPCTST